MAPSTSSPASSSTSKLDDLVSSGAAKSQPDPQPIPGEASSDPEDSADEEIWTHPSQHPLMASSTNPSPTPSIFTTLPLIRDLLNTTTSFAQDDTVQECLPFLAGTADAFPTYNAHGVPALDRPRHVRFLHKFLQQLPAPYVSADAARPWFFYWVLGALSTLGEDVAEYRQRLVSTVAPMQNPGGGFGSGHGHRSHLAPTYATVLALAIVGGERAMDVVDREAMWRWLGELKAADGGFRMSVGGEEDVRGAYCAATLVTLLNLPIELPPDAPARSAEITDLFSGLPEYVGRCQSYEGGIASHPDAEAHGAYAFCALACLCILGEPHIVIPKYLDLPRLISWLSARQYAPEGGFAGRTNKLVDGCYAHWVGGCWPLIEAGLSGPNKIGSTHYSREGLTRYILCCCQDTSRRGGMRDKPSMNSDAYHTCYVLAGLSSAQHVWTFGGKHESSPEITGSFTAPYKWTSEKYRGDQSGQIFDEPDLVNRVHPVFVIPEGAAEAMRAYYMAKGEF